MKTGAVLFDMDGVLVDSMKYHAEAWIRVLDDYGIRLDETDIFKREGMPGRESIVDICVEKGVPVPGAEELDSLHEKKHILFEAQTVRVYPGVVEMLEFLAGRNMATALVTGSLKRAVEHVLPEEVLARFGAVVTAEDVQHGKPDPEPYLTALEKLFLSADSAMVIENSPMGILSARRAGLYCIALETTLPAHYLSGADMILRDHDVLYDFLRKRVETDVSN